MTQDDATAEAPVTVLSWPDGLTHSSRHWYESCTSNSVLCRTRVASRVSITVLIDGPIVPYANVAAIAEYEAASASRRAGWRRSGRDLGPLLCTRL